MCARASHFLFSLLQLKRCAGTGTGLNIVYQETKERNFWLSDIVDNSFCTEVVEDYLLAGLHVHVLPRASDIAHRLLVVTLWHTCGIALF